MKKLCGVVVTVVVLAGTAAPAAAASTGPQGVSRLGQGWICKILPIRCF